MASPAYELQVAIVARLRATADLSSVVGNRIYDVVPDGAEFPYITLGTVDETSDDADCIDAFELSMDIDIWSREPGFQQCKTISDAVRNALRCPDLELATNALVYFNHRQTRSFRDPDGLTSHAVMTFEGVAEQP
jgi:hypothetical protein